MFEISRNIDCLGCLYIILTVIGVVLGYEFQRKCFRLDLEKCLSVRD